MEFVVTIPAEKRRIKEMKYKLYISELGYNVQDIKNKTVIKSEVSMLDESKDELQSILSLLIDCLEKLYEKHTPEDQQQMNVQIISESIYLNNLIKEYIPMWKEQNFERRPNETLLQKLYPLLQKSKTTSTRTSRSECESLRLVY